MKILVVSHAMVVDVYREKLKYLRAGGKNEVLLVTAKKWLEGGQIVRMNHNDKYCQPISIVRLRGYHGALFFYGPAIINCIKNFKADIIYIDEEYFSFVILEILLLKKLFSSKSKCVFFTYQNIDKRYPIPFSLVERYALRHTDGALAANEEAANILFKRGYIKPVKVLAQFGVDSSFVTDEVDRTPAKTFRIGYVGRIEKIKGIDTLLLAASQLDFEYKLRLIGDGEFMGEALKLSKQLGIGKRIEIISSVAHQDVPGHLAQLDVLVLPSKTTATWKEQFGRVLIEAMASGVPVIGSNSGAIPEVIGDAGLIFHENSSDELREKILALANNVSLWKSFSVKGRERVLKSYTASAVASETLKFCEKILH